MGFGVPLCSRTCVPPCLCVQDCPHPHLPQTRAIYSVLGAPPKYPGREAPVAARAFPVPSEESPGARRSWLLPTTWCSWGAQGLGVGTDEAAVLSEKPAEPSVPASGLVLGLGVSRVSLAGRDVWRVGLGVSSCRGPSWTGSQEGRGTPEPAGSWASPQSPQRASREPSLCPTSQRALHKLRRAPQHSGRRTQRGRSQPGRLRLVSSPAAAPALLASVPRGRLSSGSEWPDLWASLPQGWGTLIFLGRHVGSRALPALAGCSWPGLGAGAGWQAPLLWRCPCGRLQGARLPPESQ